MTSNARQAPGEPARDDRILSTTKVALIVVVPFLVLAFLILHLFPERSGERFAWAIKPAMTSLFIGAGYLGGGYQFVQLIFGREWHRYSMAFPPVMTFTVAMLAATLPHWDRFEIHHFPFQLWVVLYVVTPFLVTWLWWTNRRTDPVAPAGRCAAAARAPLERVSRRPAKLHAVAWARAGGHGRAVPAHGGALTPKGRYIRMNIAMTAAAITAVANQPRIQRRRFTTKGPMTAGRDARSIITTMIGTEITPFTIAAHRSIFIESTPVRSMAIPSTVAALRMR